MEGGFSGGARRQFRRTFARGAMGTARGLLLLFALAFAAWLAGLVWFAETIPVPSQTQLSEEKTDAVVVLTGGPLRLRTGIEILDAGLAQKLFVSGVYRGVDVSELLRTVQQTPEAAECCIVLGHAADNTAGNALETKVWMMAEAFHSLRLVTASYHLKRSLLEFQRSMPDIEIVPHPVFTEGFMRETWWAWPGTLALVATEYSKFLIALIRPWLPAPDTEGEIF
jgi:uncharacterized SAM-binding protein YcdF (DUF218 family)